MENQVFETIVEYSKKTNNKCGISIASIQVLLNINQQVLKPILLKFYQKKKITIR